MLILGKLADGGPSPGGGGGGAGGGGGGNGAIERIRSDYAEVTRYCLLASVKCRCVTTKKRGERRFEKRITLSTLTLGVYNAVRVSDDSSDS